MDAGPRGRCGRVARGRVLALGRGGGGWGNNVKVTSCHGCQVAAVSGRVTAPPDVAMGMKSPTCCASWLVGEAYCCDEGVLLVHQTMVLGPALPLALDRRAASMGGIQSS